MSKEDSFRDRLVNDLPPAFRAGVQQRLAGEEKPPKIRKFHLNRQVDESGVSGTGIVAVGIVFPSGRAILEWVSKRTQADSLGIYDNMEDVEKVHGHAGATEIVFDEE
jgi:hypothetical protein